MLKKNYFILAMLSLGVIACQKEELRQNVSNSSSKVSNYEESQTRKFKKEIVVYDETNKNNIMIALHADDENVILDFLNNNELKINASDSDIDKALRTPMSSSELGERDQQGDLNTEPKLVIELIKQNIDSENKYFSLSFESKDSNKNYQAGYPIGFETNTQVVGSVHLGFGYSYLQQYDFKKNWWNISWDDVWVAGVNAWLVNPEFTGVPYYNYYDFSNVSTHRRKMVIRPDRRQSSVNYKVFYSTMSVDAFSRECPLGSYNSNVFGECYYGTVPLGSVAFTYNYGGSSGVWFMYTTTNGTCSWQPESGSGFDGANCKVVQIPPSRVGTEYIWSRNLNIQSYRIGEI
jgi:hypothetical protein